MRREKEKGKVKNLDPCLKHAGIREKGEGKRASGSLPKACWDSGLLALRPCHSVAYDLRFSAKSFAYGRFTFAFRQTWEYFNRFPNKRQEKNEKKELFFGHPREACHCLKLKSTT